MAGGPHGDAGLRAPRILVTGFGPFPGARENPTERMIAALGARPPALPAGAELRLEVLPVDYRAVPERLSALGKDFAPQIAIHFGLSLSAEGFRLERIARNGIRAEKPDVRGDPGRPGCIRDGAGDFASSLPLEAVHAALSAAGLPVAYSEDAGGYLCNYLFYLSRGHFCAGFAPGMAGFVHVPPLDSGAMTLDGMTAGAAAIIETCASRWLEAAAPA